MFTQAVHVQFESCIQKREGGSRACHACSCSQSLIHASVQTRAFMFEVHADFGVAEASCMAYGELKEF